MEAQAALSLADTEEERRDAERLVGSATKAAATAAARSAPPPTVSPADSASAAAAGGASNPSRGAASRPLASPEDMQALNKSCQSGDNTACGRLLPVVEAECAQKVPSACGFAGFLYERGRGVAADAARAAGFYRQSCDAGDRMGCVGFALLQARGSGITMDAAKAQATLNELCTGGLLEACTQLAILVVPGGTPADLASGRELLTKACDGQHARACELLKSMPKPTK